MSSDTPPDQPAGPSAANRDRLEESLLEAFDRIDALNRERGRLIDQHGDLEELRSELRIAQAKYRSIAETLAENQARSERVDRVNQKLSKRLAREEAKRAAAERKLSQILNSRAWRLVSLYWNLAARLRQRRQPTAPGGETIEEVASATASAGDTQLSTHVRSGASTTYPESLGRFREQFRSWTQRAADADAPEVVFMFSGTTYVQEKRGNRPIRLTRVFIEEGTPVFFNYYRWNATEPIPSSSEHPLLFQSPIDVTPELLDELLESDFGNKRKVLFASFPHDLMVRNLIKARQYGWVVVYDARDDWEEFAKVGAAPWYKRPYEWYVTREADIVTAVSAPLAYKMATLAHRDDVAVNPNGLDPAFPRPPRPRRPQTPPVIGYFGHLTDQWFHWDLVLKTAEAYPEWRFELAGHQAPTDLELPPNITLMGLLTGAELAEASVHWSAAIIPFQMGSLADSVDPIKVYEYLHLGLPVLSTYFPQMRDYPGVTMAESEVEFIELLAEVAGSSLDDDLVGPWLARNTWHDRIAEYRRMIDALPGAHGVERLLEVSA